MGRFKQQGLQFWIQSLASFNLHLLSANVWNDESKEKEADKV